MRQSFFFALLGSVFALTAVPAAALDTVYVVRHAQKNTSIGWSTVDGFRPVSPKGARCAGLLAKTLRNRGIAAVYSSEVGRTLVTAAAVSSTHDDVVVIGDDATLKPTAEFVHQLRRRHSEDRAILIVGHSNTVDDVVLAFRPDVEPCLERYHLAQPGSNTSSIPDTQYGDVWRLELGSDQVECSGVNRQRLGRTGEYDCSTP